MYKKMKSYICTEYFSKNWGVIDESSVAKSWQKLAIWVITLSKVKSDRKRQTLYEITYMWKLKYSTNELIYKTETDSQI